MWSHLDWGKNPNAKTTFATAKQNCNYGIFEEFAFLTNDSLVSLAGC